LRHVSNVNHKKIKPSHDAFGQPYCESSTPFIHLPEESNFLVKFSDLQPGHPGRAQK